MNTENLHLMTIKVDLESPSGEFNTLEVLKSFPVKENLIEVLHVVKAKRSINEAEN